MRLFLSSSLRPKNKKPKPQRMTSNHLLLFSIGCGSIFTDSTCDNNLPNFSTHKIIIIYLFLLGLIVMIAYVEWIND